MSRLESAETIEAKVGAKRHPTQHIGRATPVTERVYILHSQDCLNTGVDLRSCKYSIALDNGIDLNVWAPYLDHPVRLLIDPEDGDLVPSEIPVSTMQEGTDA